MWGGSTATKRRARGPAKGAVTYVLWRGPACRQSRHQTGGNIRIATLVVDSQWTTCTFAMYPVNRAGPAKRCDLERTEDDEHCAPAGYDVQPEREVGAPAAHDV